MRSLLISALFILTVGVIYAQPYKTIKTFKPYKWMFGVHWTAIDDNGDKFGRLFDPGKSWNILPYPTKITVDRYFKYGWSLEMAGSYTQYLPGKLINDSTNVSGIFASLDVHGKYSFYQQYAPRARWIDPYFTFGVGYTYRSAGAFQHTPTVNAGFGINLWIYGGLGVQLHSTAKFAVYPGFWNTPENYLQHSAGVVLRIKSKNNNRSDFHRRKNKWAHGKKRYKGRKGGQ